MSASLRRSSLPPSSCPSLVIGEPLASRPLRNRARITRLDRDPLDFIERYGIRRAVVELRRARALMRRHGLGVLERPAGLEIGRDARRPEHMAPELDAEAALGGAPADHAIGVDAMHRRIAEAAGSAERGAEEGSLAVVTDAGRGNVGAPGRDRDVDQPVS
jgi:hypothetical protein